MSSKEKNSTKTLHIGQLVYHKIQEKRLTYTEVSRRINVALPTLTAYFNNESLQSRIIQKLCLALDYNFFEEFTNALPEHIQNTNTESKRAQEIEALKKIIEDQKKEIAIYKELISKKL
jgi:transcriptional regulator with XRE-family HTH domain